MKQDARCKLLIVLIAFFLAALLPVAASKSPFVGRYRGEKIVSIAQTSAPKAGVGVVSCSLSGCAKVEGVSVVVDAGEVDVLVSSVVEGVR